MHYSPTCCNFPVENCKNQLVKFLVCYLLTLARRKRRKSRPAIMVFRAENTANIQPHATGSVSGGTTTGEFTRHKRTTNPFGGKNGPSGTEGSTQLATRRRRNEFGGLTVETRVFLFHRHVLRCDKY